MKLNNIQASMLSTFLWHATAEVTDTDIPCGILKIYSEKHLTIEVQWEALIEDGKVEWIITSVGNEYDPYSFAPMPDYSFSKSFSIIDEDGESIDDDCYDYIKQIVDKTDWVQKIIDVIL